MSKIHLDKLVDSLKMAKEANDLTAENISKIVSDATKNIIEELKFDKELTSEVVSDVIDTASTTLKNLEEDATDHIKTSSSAAIKGLQDALRAEMDAQKKHMERTYHALTDDAKHEVKSIFDTFKSLAELSVDVISHATSGAIKGAIDALEKQKKESND